MRLGASAADLAQAVSWNVRVSSFSGAGALLADSVPIVSGRAYQTTSQQVPDRLSIKVPRFTVENNATTDWLPTTDSSPLARYGQHLDVTITAAGVDTRIGRFLIKDWDYDETTVSVEAVGLLQYAADDRLAVPMSPRDSGTLKSEFQRLLPPQMAAQFASGLANRACPKAMEWDEDRLAALYDIADAWPALLRVDSWGQVLLKPTLSGVPAPVMSFADGEGGTVIGVPRQESRDRSYNHIVARSSADGVTAQAEAVQTSGPMAVQTYGRVTKFFASPLLLTDAQCASTAQSQLAESIRQARTLQVTAAPDPRLELDDPVEVKRDGMRDWGYVVAVDLPLTVNDGPMRFDVGVS